MNALGTRVGQRYSRATPGFEEPIELGAALDIGDYRFLRAYDVLSSAADYGSSADFITTNEEIIDISDFYDTVFNAVYIENFDGDYLKNGIIGPSLASSSKNIIQLRPAKVDTAVDKKIWIDEDINGGADTLRMNLLADDKIALARIPRGWDSFDSGREDETNLFLPRKPKIINIDCHANSLMANLDVLGASWNEYLYGIVLVMPVTSLGSVDPNFSYRFSFYYRINGTCKITPVVSFFSGSGGQVGSATYLATTVSGTAAENSDYEYFQIAIPTTIDEIEHIPETARKMQIVLYFSRATAISDTEFKFEFVYPVIEHSYNMSVVKGYSFIPYAPSDFSYKENFSGKLSRSLTNRNIAFDFSKLAFGHSGRKLFNVSMGFDQLDSVYLNQLRTFEQLNNMGFKIALRPKHPDLPPVMLGNLKIQNRNRHPNYYINDVTLEFEETI